MACVARLREAIRGGHFTGQMKDNRQLTTISKRTALQQRVHGPASTRLRPLAPPHVVGPIFRRKRRRRTRNLMGPPRLHSRAYRRSTSLHAATSACFTASVAVALLRAAASARSTDASRRRGQGGMRRYHRSSHQLETLFVRKIDVPNLSSKANVVVEAVRRRRDDTTCPQRARR